MSHSQAARNKCRLATMFTLNFAFFFVELGVGSYTKSMALVADSFHMLSDVAALVVAFFAVKLSQKKWSKNTYGWARAEVLGALVNSVFLVALCFSIFIDSVKRFLEPEKLKDPLLILVVGTIGLVMNLVGLCIFSEPHSHSHSPSRGSQGAERTRSSTALTHSNRLTRMVQSNVKEAPFDAESGSSIGISEMVGGDSLTISLEGKALQESHKKGELDKYQRTPREKTVKKKYAAQMNIRGVFLHLMADTLGSVIVVISALVVWQTDWEYNKYIDPALSMVMVILILISVQPLLIESSLILLQSVPDHIKIDELERTISKQIDGVIGIHELHVWQLAGDRSIATVHIKCSTLQEYFDIAPRVMRIFHDEGIHSATIQPEFSQQSPENGEQAVECYLSCSTLSTEATCSANKCCPPNGNAGPSSKTQLP